MNRALENAAERKARTLRIMQEHAAVLHIVKRGACPLCGRVIRRNLSLSGWWQCSQFGAIGFRKDPEQPSCDWQGFTE